MGQLRFSDMSSVNREKCITKFLIERQRNSAKKSNDSNSKLFVTSCLENMINDSNLQTERIHSEIDATKKDTIVVVER